MIFLEVWGCPTNVFSIAVLSHRLMVKLCVLKNIRSTTQLLLESGSIMIT